MCSQDDFYLFLKNTIVSVTLIEMCLANNERSDFRDFLRLFYGKRIFFTLLLIQNSLFWSWCLKREQLLQVRPRTALQWIVNRRVK